MGTYRDRWIECSSEEVRIRGYYFPWGTKRIPYTRIRGLERVTLGAMRGKGRIWGTSNPRYWLSLDPRRPTKSVALVIDTGGFVHPVITPDGPDAAEAVIRAATGLAGSGREERGPLV